MPDSRFSQSLNQQVANEFAASQQYIAIAVHYDNDALQLLAAYFYAQALEERNHAMMMVQYLMDTDLPVTIPGIEAPITSFTSLSAPIALALDQEKRVSAQIADLVGAGARGGRLPERAVPAVVPQGAGRGGLQHDHPPAGRRACGGQRPAGRGLPGPDAARGRLRPDRPGRRRRIAVGAPACRARR